MSTRKMAGNRRQLPRPQPDNEDQSKNASMSTAAETRFIKRPAVSAKTGLSKSSVYAAIKKGEFPAPVKIGGRASAWVAEEIDRWQESKMQARSSGADLAKPDDGKLRSCGNEPR